MTKKLNYQKLRDELDEILASLQDSSLDIDEAVKQHKRATEIIAQLEEYLREAENNVTVLQNRPKTDKS